VQDKETTSQLSNNIMNGERLRAQPSNQRSLRKEESTKARLDKEHSYQHLLLKAEGRQSRARDTLPIDYGSQFCL
jgi:hypothetical protein